MAYARFAIKPDTKSGNNARNFDTTTIHVWSPLVKEPKAVRYAWATSPMGNLKVGGRPWLPLPSFRTDNWDYPESDDPAVLADTGGKAADKAAAERCEQRKTREAELAKDILQRLKTLSSPMAEAKK
jgi:hypothetical protein